MKIIKTSLPGVLVLEPRVYGDSRGFLLESFREDVFQEAGVQQAFVQDNHSRSSKGVLRGLHYQLIQPQGKLVRVARGEVFDVAVDVRAGSPTFGQWFGTSLDEENMRMVYVPPGFAHGFVVLSEVADVIYKCTDYYHPESEQGILWNDPDIGIEWPLAEAAIAEAPLTEAPPSKLVLSELVLSEKDAKNRLLKDQPEELLPLYLSNTASGSSGSGNRA